MVVILVNAVDDKGVILGILGGLLAVHLDELWGGQEFQPWLANALVSLNAFHGEEGENGEHQVFG